MCALMVVGAACGSFVFGILVGAAMERLDRE